MLSQETPEMADDHKLPDASPTYAVSIRRHPRVVVCIAAVAVLVGVVWLAVRSPAYQASAEILVAPVSSDDRALVGLDVVPDAAGDPTRTIQTAASLLEAPSSAAAAARTLGRSWTAPRVRDSVRVEPLGQTNLVAVTARGSSPRQAASVANAYAAAALSVRDRVVSAQIAQRLDDLDAQLAALPHSSQAAADLTARRDELTAVRGDPSLSLAQAAEPPTATTGTPGWLMLGVILAIGLAVGTATAAALDALDRQRPGLLRSAEPRQAPHATQASSPDLRSEASTRPVPPVAREAEAELVAVLARAMHHAGPNITRNQFDAWRRAQTEGNGGGALPSAAVISRGLGGWAAARKRSRAVLGRGPDPASTQTPPADDRASRPRDR